MKPNEVDPLVQCLLAMARFYDTTASEESITAGLPLVDGKLSPSLFNRAAARLNLTSNVISISLEQLKAEHYLPIILINDNGAACVLTGWNESGTVAHVILPELNTATSKVPFEQLQTRYSGAAIMVKPIFQFDQGLTKRKHAQDGHWFWSAIKANRVVYRDVLVAAFFINVFALALPIFTMNVYDRVVPNHAMETLWMLAGGVVLIMISDAVLKTVRSYFLDLAGRRVDIQLSAKIMERVLGLRLEARPNSVGSFASNLRSFESVRDFITSASINTLIDLPFSLLFVIVIGWIAWPMIIPVLIAVVIVLLYALATQARLKTLTESMYVAGAMRNSTLVESLVGLETLKAMGAEGTMQRKWEQSTNFLARVGVQLRILSTSSINITQWTQQLCSVAVIILGVYLITQGELSMGGLIAINMLSSRVLLPFAQAAGLILQYHNAATSLDSLEEVMNKPVEREQGRQFLSRNNFNGNLSFNNVSFGYPSADIETLREISFDVKQGETVIVLGRVGSGKSTILKLAMGLYAPTAGAISLDGIDIRQLDPADLRLGVGYVPQDVVLFKGTLRENIMLAQRHVSDDDIMRAADMAGIAEYIKRHPKGLDMEVGERGESLSGGQRKAVALARALVHSPSVMFMDEPTGSMDHSTEAAVVRALKQYSVGRTLFVITHRTSLIDMADRIIVVDNGKIVANGPRDNVVEALRQGKIGKAM
jgi:ATP-binding cassette subfamily C protein LapB